MKEGKKIARDQGVEMRAKIIHFRVSVEGGRSHGSGRQFSAAVLLLVICWGDFWIKSQHRHFNQVQSQSRETLNSLLLGPGLL